MDLELSERTGLLVVRVRENRIDAAAAIQFKDSMRAATEAHCGDVLLDLAQVEFIDSSGLGAIVAAMKQVGGERRLDLAALTQNVEKVFRLTRMDSVFSIHPSVSDAVAARAG